MSGDRRGIEDRMAAIVARQDQLEALLAEVRGLLDDLLRRLRATGTAADVVDGFYLKRARP